MRGELRLKKTEEFMVPISLFGKPDKFEKVQTRSLEPETIGQIRQPSISLLSLGSPRPSQCRSADSSAPSAPVFNTWPFSDPPRWPTEQACLGFCRPLRTTLLVTKLPSSNGRGRLTHSRSLQTQFPLYGTTFAPHRPPTAIKSFIDSHATCNVPKCAYQTLQTTN